VIGRCSADWLWSGTSDIDIITADCVAVAAAAGGVVVTSYSCSGDAAVPQGAGCGNSGGGRSSPVDPCYDDVDDDDDYSVQLSRLHQQSQSVAALRAGSLPHSASYCSSVAASSQMRSGMTHLHGTTGVVRAGTSLHAGQTGGPCTAAQTALSPYTAVGFALSPADMMRQPPLAGFQGITAKLRIKLDSMHLYFATIIALNTQLNLL